jgi:signal transduction histidine kinase
VTVRIGAAVVVVGLIATAIASIALQAPLLEAIELTAASAGAAAVAGALGALLLYAVRRRSIVLQSVLVALTPVAAVAAGGMAASQMMVASSHPVAALGVVLTSAGTVAILLSLALGARLRAGSARLISATRQIGHGDPRVLVERPAAGELAVLAAELEAMQARLESSRARERELEDARRGLVSWISHDLRTPLARIRAIVEALEDDVVASPAEVDGYHARLHAEADRLGTLVNDLFELNRINVGELALELERTSLSDVVSDVVASFSVIAEARGITLHAHPPDENPEVRLSVPHFERALGNLLDNALRYTEPDGVVEIAVVPDTTHVAVTVADGCGGMELAMLEQFLAGSAEPRPIGADGKSGLGLAIAKGLVEAQGGAIAVEGTSRGCQFAVTLPLAPARAPGTQANRRKVPVGGSG